MVDRRVISEFYLIFSGMKHLFNSMVKFIHKKCKKWFQFYWMCPAHEIVTISLIQNDSILFFNWTWIKWTYYVVWKCIKIHWHINNDVLEIVMYHSKFESNFQKRPLLLSFLLFCLDPFDALADISLDCRHYFNSNQFND